MKRILGLFFEDFEEGMIFESMGRTITETDIVNFCGLSGDFSSLHTDAVYAKSTPFGERIAHGMCGLSIATGLLVRLNIFEGTIVAFYGIDKWRFRAPIKIGTTIYVKAKVIEKKEKNPSAGLVVFECDVVDEKGTSLMGGIMRTLIAKKPVGGGYG